VTILIVLRNRNNRIRVGARDSPAPRIPLGWSLATIRELSQWWPEPTWSSAFQASRSGKWGKIPILFGLALHQLNDHRKQTIAGLNSYSGTSDIANHDVNTGSSWPKIHRRHGAELWRSFFVRHPLPFRFRPFCVRFRYLHRRFVNRLEKRMDTRTRRNAYLNLIPHPLSHR